MDYSNASAFKTGSNYLIKMTVARIATNSRAVAVDHQQRLRSHNRR
jgi:hypothetical protein